MINFKCKMCGGTLSVEKNQQIATCEFCGTTQTLPVFDDEKKTAFYNRANALRLDCQFDKAAGVYETLVVEYPKEAEAYWGLVLCKYGIEYVDDKSGVKIPICHKTRFESIFDDSDYQKAVEYANVLSREIYIKEAAQIDKLQENILQVYAKQDPYDIFICYKETDINGERTEDSEIAFEIYEKLTELKYKVFFAKITLESVLGKFYEPYIFSALQTSRLMIHVTTSKENSESVWVKNEWERYISLIKNGQEKTIITCYKYITPNDLPFQLKSIQAQDMSKIGAMQDLLNGIKKILSKNKEVLNLLDDSSVQKNTIEKEYRDKVKELKELDEYCLNSDDIQPIIKFFEKNITYKDSERWLNEAKYQYSKRVNNFYQCLQALDYLKEITDGRNIADIEDKITEQAVLFRTKELQESRIAPLTDKTKDIYTLESILGSLIDFQQINKEELSDFDKMIIQDCSAEAIEFIKSNFNDIVYKETKKTELKRIADLVYDLHDGVEFSGFFLSCENSVKKRIAEIEEYEKTNRRKRRNRIIAIAVSVLMVIIAIILIVVTANTKKQAGYSAENFTLKVVSKTNDKFNESLADGYIGAGYYYTFKFEITNQSPYTTNKIVGNMDVLNSNGKVLSTSVITLTGSLDSGTTKSWDVQLNVSKGDEAKEIWNTPLDLLEITFKITNISFQDGTNKRYSDTKNVVIHSVSKNIDKNDSAESKYQYALSLFESKKYEEAMQIFTSLDSYKQSIEYATICEQKIFYSTMKKKLKYIAGDDVILPDNCEVFSYSEYQYTYFQGKEYPCFFADVSVAKNDTNYLVNFRQKLISNGYIQINEFEYTKGYTVVQFSDLQEGYSDNNINYYAFSLTSR